MIESVTRFLNMIVAGLLAHASRLAKLAAAQHEISQYTAALDEADLLENTGVPAKQKLAKLLRLQVEQTLETAFTSPASPPQPAALNGDGLIGGGGAHHPFALSGPTEASASSAEGRVTRRRGRPPLAAKRAVEQEAPKELTVTPAAENSDTQPSEGATPWLADA